MHKSAPLHIDKLLTQISIGMYNDPEEYFADKFFPSISNIAHRSDLIPRYDEDAWFRDEAKIRAKGNESYGTTWDLLTPLAYYCEDYAIHNDIAWEDMANADAIYDLQRTGTEFVTDKILMRRDSIFIARFLKTGVWGVDQNMVSTTQWSNPASTPIEDFENARVTMSGKIGKEPKKLLIGRKTLSALKQHPDFLDRIKYTQRGIVTKELIMAMLEVDELYSPNTLKNTAKEGQTAVKTRMVGDVALLIYVTPRPALIRPTAGYIFNWKMPPVNTPIYIRRFSLTRPMVDRIEGHSFVDMVATSPAAGHFFYNTIA